LHLLSDDARIELQDAEGKTVCKTPCNADVPVLYGDSFTLSGPGLRSSDAFAFDRDDTDVTLRVHAGSGGRVIGYVFAGLGGGIALTSLAWLGLASIPSPAQDGRPVTVGSGPYIGLGVGLAIAALGGLVILNTRPTTEFSREP